MSPQADYVVSNGTGAAVRSDINGQLAAIVSNNSGASAPATTYAYQFWADTSTNLLKLRNGANSAFITVGDLTAANLGLATLASPTFTGTATIPTLTVSTAANIPLGSAASPTLYFTGDSNTGLYSPGADQVALSTGGTGRLFIDSSGRCGIGTSSPLALLDVRGNVYMTGNGTSRQTTAVVNTGGSLESGVESSAGAAVFSGSTAYASVIGSQNSTPLQFGTNGVIRATLDTSGRLGIGTQSPGRLLTLDGGASSVYLQLTNTAAGSSAPNGFEIFCDGTNAGLLNRENGYLAFDTNSLERARIDSSGRWLLGTSSARGNAFYSGSQTANIQEEGTTFAGSALSLTRNENSAASPTLILAKTRGTALSATTIVSSGDQIGKITFQGADGTNFVEAGEIKVEIDGTPGANDMPGRLVFSTTSDSASSPTERLRITQAGLTKISSNGGSGSTRYTNTSNHVIHNAIDDQWALAVQSSGSTKPYGITVEYTAADPNTAAYEFLYCAGNGTARASIRSNGGIANYSGNNVNLSDINTKKDISPAAGTWDCIKEWEIVNYRYKDQPDDADLNLGVIAQQVAQSCPEVITVFQEAKEATEDQPAQEERLGVKEQQMYWMAIKALQEAQVRIEQLEAKVAALESA